MAGAANERDQLDDVPHSASGVVVGYLRSEKFGYGSPRLIIFIRYGMDGGCRAEGEASAAPGRGFRARSAFPARNFRGIFVRRPTLNAAGASHV